MRRWFLLCLVLVVLPFQQVWAAAAPYCLHESAPGAVTHLGHHEHRHAVAGANATAAADTAAAEATGAFHADCASCHLGAAATLPEAAPSLDSTLRQASWVRPMTRYRSHTSETPERPQIDRPNPAARFAGSVGEGPAALA